VNAFGHWLLAYRWEIIVSLAGISISGNLGNIASALAPKKAVEEKTESEGEYGDVTVRLFEEGRSEVTGPPVAVALYMTAQGAASTSLAAQQMEDSLRRFAEGDEE
jgi:hypothetical protein